MSLLIQPLDYPTIKPLVNLASQIWHEHYEPIIGKEQVKYMLDKFQSETAIKQQMKEGYQYYSVFEILDFDEKNTELMGYFSIKEDENNGLFISKFYLSDKARGKKYGREMLYFIENEAKKLNKASLDLTVNKFNDSYKIYLKLGFEKVGSAQFDIGKGYIMDDYILKKPLEY